MPIRMDNPHEVGADRLVNAVAAYERIGTTCIAVDFGTAVNYDVVSCGGEYLGGVISPGIEVSLDALAERAARLSKVDLEAPQHAIGRTNEALQSGSSTASRARSTASSAASARSWARRRRPSRPAATRGDHRAACDLIDEVDDLLTLTGLRLIWERNSPLPSDAPCARCTDTWTLGGRTIANRLVLAPLAGIGNWFVRLQAQPHGAGLVVSEMVSSFGLKYGDERTVTRVPPDPSRRAPGLDPAVRPRRRRHARRGRRWRPRPAPT